MKKSVLSIVAICVIIFIYFSLNKNEGVTVVNKSSLVGQKVIPRSNLAKKVLTKKKEVLPSVDEKNVGSNDDKVVKFEAYENINEEFEKCFKSNQNFANVMTLKNDLLGKEKPDFNKYIQYEITHSNGKKGLFEVTSEFNESGKQVSVLQIFELDQEGFPESLEVPEKYRVNPSSEDIKKLLKNYSVNSFETADSYSVHGKIIDVVLKDDQVKEIKITENNSVFICEAGSCLCQKF